MNDHRTPVDVLFVNPPSPDGFIYIRDINRHGRSSWERMIWPQTNLAILAAVAEKAGLTVDVVDCIAERIAWPEFERILGATRPRFCFSNLISATYANDVRALRRAKEISGAVTVGMGPHITDSPGRSLEESEGLDFVIRNEAEATLEELLTVFQRKEASVDRLRQIAGIAFVPERIEAGSGRELVVTGPRPYIEDLDTLPRPRYDLLPLDRYWAPLLGSYVFIEASRGCPYRCTFCRQAVMYQWRYRTRSGRSLAAEAIYLASLGVRRVLFHADTFTVDTRMVEELCDELIRAGSPVRWACNTHSKNVHGRLDLLRKMKQAGCWMIAIGIESGDDQILRNIKKNTTTQIVREAVNQIDAAGIEVWGYFVLGFPGESPATIEKTIRYATELPLQIAKFDVGSPYPGTEFYSFARDNGYLRATRPEDFDQNASAVVEYPGLSPEQIMDGVRRAHRRFYIRPRILARLAREALDPKSLVTLLLIARDQFRLLAGRRGRAGVGTAREAQASH